MLTDTDWSELYLAHGPGILRYLRRIAGDNGIAEDLMHDAFTRAMAAQSVPEKGTERGYWLYRIATNLAVDHLRRARRFRWLPFSKHEAASPSTGSDETELVRSALQSIQPDQAVVLLLRVQEGYSRGEIAAMLEISEAAVKSRLLRARENFAAAYRRLDRGLAR